MFIFDKLFHLDVCHSTEEKICRYFGFIVETRSKTDF